MDYSNVFVVAGRYNDTSQAKMDFDRLSDLHKQDMIGKFQAAVFEKESNGKVKVLDTTSTSRGTGAKWGLAVGAAIGLIFPPALIASALGGAGVGAVTGNLSKGWFKGDVKRVADALQPGQAGVVAVAEAGETLDEMMILAAATEAQKERVTGEDAEKLREQLGSEQTVGAAR